MVYAQGLCVHLNVQKNFWHVRFRNQSLKLRPFGWEAPQPTHDLISGTVEDMHRRRNFASRPHVNTSAKHDMVEHDKA